MTQTTEATSLVRTGDEYRESLRDGRTVCYQGKEIDDVTTDRMTRGGVNTIADMYDSQHTPEGQELLTYVREDGARVTASYLVPRTIEDLTFRRKGIEFVTRQTFGVYGRGMDMIAELLVGFYSAMPSMRKLSPEFADNLEWYRSYAEENNIHLAETIVDTQGYRSRGAGTAPDTAPPERAVLRVTKKTDEGVWISGVKAVGTAAPVAHEVLVGNLLPVSPEEAGWFIVPINADGVKVFCREAVHLPDTTIEAHPIDARGEEFESLVAFDNVFVPRERVFSLEAPELNAVDFYYYALSGLEHWYTFVRMTAKAELYAGLAQLVVDTLELEKVQVVRQRVAEIFEYAAILRAMAMASEQKAELSESGVMIPHLGMVSIGRSYALQHLPMIYHTLIDICGQGPMLRFSQEDLDTPAAFGKNLGWFLDSRNVSAREKQQIMSLVWDAAGGANAARVKMFETQNSQNVPFIRERVYGEYEVDDFVAACRSFLGIPQRERTAWRVPGWYTSGLVDSKGDGAKGSA
jgi:4-hydroxyphenylacetate 3-monooxygenase